MPVGDPNDPLYSAHSQRGREGMSAAEREQLRNAAQRDREQAEDPQAQAVNMMAGIIAEWRPIVEKMRNLRGQHPVKVVGEIVSIDPNAVGAGGGDDASFTAIVCVNGFPFYAKVNGKVQGAIS